ncbi:hypothetical protein [Sporisorium scitamineum]|uniref:Uncharacterized protein n=1 Tax=Sporisorium scitamineum TaxID=49012 RepID=A0A0F7SBW2_9BASI|nr:hypothetical protein [Sporisorium scitamineum]
MSVATHQPSPPSPHPLPPSTPRFQNFRPLRYQTTEELDRFFGTTLAQRREQRLRVRDSNGQIYFDWIEKDEWQHLLATGSLTSPSSPSGEAEAGGRRSSGWTCMTLESPLCEAAWSGRRASSVGEASRRVDDCVALNNNAEDSWIKTRRQSDEYPYSPRSFCAVSNDDRIRISRLPLRKLDQQSLDQAFGSTTRKPSTLHIPDIIQSVELDDETTHDSSWTASPMVTLDSTSARRASGGAKDATFERRHATSIGDGVPREPNTH